MNFELKVSFVYEKEKKKSREVHGKTFKGFEPNDHSSDRRFIKSIFQESSDPGDVFMLSVYERLNTVLLPKSKNKIGGKCCQNPPNTRS